MWLNEVFTKSFANIKSNYKTWLLVGLIFAVLGIPSLIVSETSPVLPDTADFSWDEFMILAQDSRPTGALLYLSLLSNLLTLMITPGLIAISLMAARGKNGKIGQIIEKASLFIKLIGFSIVYVVMIVFGTLALVFPGIYLLLRYSMTPFILIDKGDIGVFDAMKESSEIMKGNYWKLLFNQVILVLAIIAATAFIAAVTLPLGLIFSIDSLITTVMFQILGVFVVSVTYPMWSVGSAVIYTKILEGKEAGSTTKSK